MAEDILGISGQMDISDIQQSFDKLIGDLNQLGVKTDEVSGKMSKALNDIAQSAASDSEKTKQSIEVYKSGIADINKALETTPEALKKLGAEATTAEATLDKLKNKLSEAQEGSQKWNEINEQLKNQQNLVNKLNGEYDTMLGTFGNTQQYVGTLNAAIDALNAGRSVSTAVTGTSAVAHTGVTAAVGAEALAHGENSSKIAEETKVTQENTKAKLKLTKTEEEYSYNAQMEAEQIQKVAQRLAEGRSDEEEYINTKKSGMAVREAIVEKMEAEKQKIKELSELYANSQDTNGGTVTPEVQQQYNDGVKEATENLKEYRSELASVNAALDSLETGHFKAKTAINEQADATENLKNKTDEAKEASDVYFMGEKATIESVTKAMQEMEAELKSLKEEEKSLKGAGGDNTEKLKENEEGQKRLNQYISEGHEALRQLGTNYKEAQKEAKEVAKETKNIGDKADEAAKKAGGIFSKLKDAVSGALKGDFSGIFKMIGKLGAWGAALGAIGKGVYDLTIRAEKFRDALQPLSRYIDSNELSDVRQNILALASTTTKTVDDMAKAATQYVKVWDSLRNSPEALTIMIKASNEFGALSGKTSEEAAKYLSNLASEYHMTAQEATEASAMIATAAHGSTSTFGEMADALKSVGSTAAMYGVSFREMATLVGYSSNQFGGASQAASEFSMLLMSMSKLQKEYNPSIVGMVTALKNLKAAYDRGENVEKNFTAHNKAAAMYFIKNAKAIGEYEKKIDDTKAKQYLLNDANAKASTNIAELQNAWNGFLTSINANLTPTLTRILQFFNKIIGGSQKTADELNYLNNFDKIHKNSNKGKKYTETVTSGWTAAFPESAVANMGAARQYDLSKEQGLELYRKQRDALTKRYNNQFKYYRNRFKKASGQAIANMTYHSMIRYFEGARDKYSEFDATSFNKWNRAKLATTLDLIKMPNNTNVDLGNFAPENKKDKEREKREEAEEKFNEDLKKREEAEEKLNEDLKKIEEQNQSDTIALMQEGTEKKLKEIDNDYKKRLSEIDKQEAEFKKKNKEAGKSGTLTSEQSSALSEARDLAKKKFDKETSDVYKEELSAMRDYLKEYGSLEQQKLAITEDYEERIKKAQTKGEKLQLQQEKKKAIANANFESISMGIDWKGLLSGVGNMSKEMLKPMLDKLEAYTKTAEFNSAGTENQQKVIDLMKEIREYIGTDQSATWQSLADAIEKFNQSVNDYKNATDNEKSAYANLENAKGDLKEGKITKEVFDNIKKQADDASQAVVDAKEKMNTFGVQLNATTDAVKNYTSGLDTALNKLTTWKGADGFSDLQGASNNISSLKGALDSVLPQMEDGMAKTIGTKISSTMGSVTSAIGSGLSGIMSKGIGAVVGVIAQIPKMVLQLADAIKNFVTGILDSFTELLKFEWLSDLVDSILSSIGNLIDAIFGLPENLFKALEKIVVNGVGGLLNSVVGRVGNILSFGALSSGGPAAWFTNSNAKKVQKTIDKLTSSNERLNDSIGRLEKTMSSTYGSDAKKAYEEAKRQQEKVNSQTLQIAKTQAGYHGAHGSWNHYLNSLRFGVTDDGQVYMSTARKEIEKEVLKATNNQKGDLWSLTPEEMNKLLGSENAVNLIKGVGKGGYGDRVLEKLQDYADLAGEIDDLTQQFYESITQISFDSMKDSFISNLMDMEKSAEDFADDFAEMMQKALLSYSMEDLINTDLKNLYNDWAKLIEDKEGKLTEDDVKELNKRYDAIVDEGLKRRDEWAKVTGYTGSDSKSEQTATGKGIEAITEDQASSLIGISYAMQIALEQGNEVRRGISLDVSLLRSYSETIGNNISEMRDIQYQGLEQLQAINKNTAPIILIREDIASMYKLMKDRY